ncbi:MAG TPA: hypothetical protein DCE42_29790 [Myxococcales bacterium]|nr:hypothetical protein [Deltaproteobacteria bacterium]MBU48064.1 hypothetical protein [Deltaproteobacteria bacterium]HAA58984.1 hypothetical protein [Myxococcales bacterium]
MHTFIALLSLFFLSLWASPSEASKPLPPPNVRLHIFPKHPHWLQHEAHRTLQLDMSLKCPPKRRVQLQFMQVYLIKRGRSTHILTYTARQLLTYAQKWTTAQTWRPHHDTTLPPGKILYLPLPTIRSVKPYIDTLLVKIFLKSKQHRISRTFTIKPRPLKPQRKWLFPVRGLWWVAGGTRPGMPHRQRLALRNSGTPFVPQRHALDLIKIAPDNTILRGSPRKNKSYLGFGQKVYAPAAGIVLKAIGHIPDRPPGHPAPSPRWGNMLLLKHAPKRYTFLAHLQHNSLKVRVGMKVKQGQHLANVGNSGNASTPHLHIQLRDHAESKRAHPLPLLFWNIQPLFIARPRLPFTLEDGQIIQTR